MITTIVRKFFRIAAIALFLAFYWVVMLFSAGNHWLFVPVVLITVLSLFWLNTLRVNHGRTPIAGAIKWGVAIITIAMFALIQLLDIVGSRQFAKVVETVKANKYPLLGSELLAIYPEVDPTQNGGPIVIACARTLVEIDIARSKPEDGELPYVDTHKGADLETLTPLQRERMKAILNACAPVLKQLETALAFPHLQARLDFPRGLALFNLELPHLGWLMHSARLLAMQSLCHKMEGNNDQAIVALANLLRLAELFRDEPLLISQFVRIAIQRTGAQTIADFISRNDQLTVEQLQRLQSLIAPLCQLNDLHKGITGEIVLAYGMFDDENLLGQSPFVSFSNLRTLQQVNGVLFLQFFWGGWVKLDLARLLQKHMDHIELLRRPEAQILQYLATTTGKHDVTIFYPISSLLYDVLRPLFLQEFRRLAIARCLWTALAVRIETLRTGQQPASLTFIPAENLKLTTDPFSGKMVEYQPAENSYVVYSIGGNWQDNQPPAASSSPKANTKDLGVEIFK